MTENSDTPPSGIGRENYRQAIVLLNDEFDKGKLAWGWTPPTVESREYKRRWLEWALKGRSSARLRQGIRETLEAMSDTPAEWRAKVFDQVCRATGVDLNEFRRAHLARVASILQRDRVRSESEFRVLRSHVDELEADPTREAELSKAYQLLGDFEVRHIKRRSLD
jgi:hypothetical protein